ncbi:SRPBCC family protein [Halomicronema sp. CCY15110]|uniref:SRPBCC family protein n=1 Tax=Halomicronema sp. CCY15110 TaxID=2767773 RepID=UPI001951E9EE|nr:SRPBCC family protein [Halomicronema sp. CCY15110]
MPPLMLERQVEVDVACSVEQVYDLWDNLENVPRWMPLVKSVEPIPREPDLWRWQFGVRFPLLVEWVSRIEQRIPGQLIAWQSISGLRNQGRAEFAPRDRGCRLRLTLAFALPGGLVGTMLEKIGLDRWLEENLVDSLHRFQTQIETEVRRHVDAPSHPAPSEVFHRENVCD